MSRIGVQMIHVCGHSGYHTLEQPKDARKTYDEMAKHPCPACQGKGDEFIVEVAKPSRKIAPSRRMVRR